MTGLPTTRREAVLWLAGTLLATAAPPRARARGLVAPILDGVRIGNGGTPFPGDRPLFATVSPGRREGRAVVRFRLRAAAVVTVEVVATARRKERVVWRSRRELGVGRHAVTWRPPPDAPPRTYLVRLSARHGDGEPVRYGRRHRLDRALPGPVVRILGIDAAFARRSHAPGETARLRVEASARQLRLELLRCGPEPLATPRNDELSGVSAAEPRLLDWESRRRGPGVVHVTVGDWASGLYFARLTAGDGRVGFAPLIVRPRRLGVSRVAVVLPTNTWHAYNLFDADGDGIGDSWYAGWSQDTVDLERPFLSRGVPPRFKGHDRPLLRWLALRGKDVDVLADDDLERQSSGDALRRLYDLVVFPGHSEYVTRHAYDVVRRYRDLGGNLMFLSANNFFWCVEKRGRLMRRTALWRDLGRPEAALLGVQYKANDDGTRQAPFVVRRAAGLEWLWAGTGLRVGDSFGAEIGGFGTEIDSVNRHSPPGTIVAAEIPHLFGRGQTAQMTYYETRSGARVFSAGVLDFGGSINVLPMRTIFVNVWNRLAPPALAEPEP